LQGCVYLEKRQDKIYLGMLTVSPLEQAKGIGKQLLIEAENMPQNKNVLVSK